MTSKQMKEAIDWFEKAIDVCNAFPLPRDRQLNAYKNALVALRYYQEHEANEPLTLDELNQIVDKCVWWDWAEGVCLCKRGYVISDYGTYSKQFVISHGKVYKDKPKENMA